MCCQQKTPSSVVKMKHSSFGTTHLPELVAYLNHRCSDQGGEHAAVNRCVHVPALHRADEFVQRSLNGVKELQGTHQSPLVLNTHRQEHGLLLFPQAKARPTSRPCCPRPPLCCWRWHTARRPWAVPWTHPTPEQRKTLRTGASATLLIKMKKYHWHYGKTPAMRPRVLNKAAQTIVRKKNSGTNYMNRSQTPEPTHQKQDFFKLTQIWARLQKIRPMTVNYLYKLKVE